MMREHSRRFGKRRWMPLALAGALLCSAWLPANALAAGDVAQARDVNHLIGATASASGREDDSPALDASKAIDGDRGTRWSSGKTTPVENEETWIAAELKSPAKIQFVDVEFENRGVDVKPSNVCGFEIQYQEPGSDAWQSAKAVENKKSGDGYETRVRVTLDKPITAKKLRLTKFNVKSGGTEWDGVSVVELEAYTNAQTDAVDTPDVNHVKGAAMDASAFEDEDARLAPGKAADGDRGTRWSSGKDAPAQNESTWLVADLAKAAKIGFVDVEFEERSADPKPGNVHRFEIQYQAPGSDVWQSAKAVENKKSGAGYETRMRVTLDQPIIAKKLRLTNFDILKGGTQWNGVSVVELEAYTNVQSVSETLDGVIKKLNKMGEQVVERDVRTLPLPEVPQGFTIELNGADFEQVIGDDRSVHHPLEDKVVQVSWKVSKDGTDEEAITNDIAYEVKCAKDQPQGKNAKPTVVPEIQEWFSDSTARVAFDKLRAVTYSDAALKPVVDEFVADYEDFTGVKLSAAQGGARDGAFNFTLAAPADDKLVGDEGYAMTIGSDRIDVAAPKVTGGMYAMQTILQMTKTEADGFPVGEMRDYPRFQVRGFMWDVARKPVSLEMMKTAARTMRYYKMNDFQAHLSDNLIFLKQYPSEQEAWKAYSAFRLETSVANDQGATPTSSDYAISKEDMRDFIQSERALGMNIVPEIDVPAHAMAFTKIWPELAVHGEKVPAGHYAIDHFDLRKPESTALIKRIFDDYTKGDAPTFDAGTVVHIGADEVLASGMPKETLYRNFVNELVPYVKDTNTVRMWGGLTWLDDGKTEIRREAIDGVQMNLWSADWADGVKMYEMGYGLINTIDDFGYMVPNGDGSRANAYGDYLNTNRVFNEFAPERVRVKGGGYKNLPSGDDQMLGAAYAIWNDNIDKSACGLSEADEYARFFDAMPFYAEKTWAPTGKEKGSADNLRALVAKTGDAPRVNPYSKADKTGDTYAEYKFDDLKDASANARDLQQGKNAKAESGKLVLAGGESYVTSPLAKVAPGSELSFDIELTRPACPGDILFEADAPYGTLDIRVMDDGRLGFTRELYDYYFDYKLPVGKKVNIRIATKAIDAMRPGGNADGGMEATALYVDGELVGRATGRFLDAGMVKKDGIENATLTLPLQRIGSETNAIAAKIDNVRVAPTASGEAVDKYNKAEWKGRTNSETREGEGNGGLLTHAFDGDASTIWHSNWNKGTFTEQNVNGSLTATPMIWAEIDFGKAHEINQFSFTPRSDVDSGRITKATLKVKATKDGAYETVATDQAFANDGKKKTFAFDTRDVYGVRLEVTDANLHGGNKYIAVSEFDIDNRPARTNTVYVEGKSYLANEDGTLDLKTGKAASLFKGSADDLDESKSVYRAEVKAGAKVTMKAESNEDLEFVGWFAPCSEKPVSTDASYVVPTDHNVALEARFKRLADDPVTPPAPAGHTVTFTVDGEVVDTVEVKSGETVAEPVAPKKDGYTFDGWYLEGEKYDFETPVTGDLALVAKFTKITEPEPKPDPKPEPKPEPEQRPADKPGNSGKPGGTLVQTGDASMIATGISLLGGAALVAAGAARSRRRR